MAKLVMDFFVKHPVVSNHSRNPRNKENLSKKFQFNRFSRFRRTNKQTHILLLKFCFKLTNADFRLRCEIESIGSITCNTQKICTLRLTD